MNKRKEFFTEDMLAGIIIGIIFTMTIFAIERFFSG